MRNTLSIALILLAASPVVAQTAPTIIVGTDAPLANGCQVLRVGDIYVRSENPANGPINVSRCTQTGSLAYAWQPIDHLIVASLPAACAVGDIAFLTGVTAGQNVYGCTSANAWTQQAGGGSGTVTVVGSGSLTSTALATGGGTTTIQTPSATTTLSSSGNLAIPSAGDISTPSVVFNAVTVLPPVTSNTGRILRYTHDTSVGACDTGGGGTAQTLCRSDGTNWLRVVEAAASGDVAIGTTLLGADQVSTPANPASGYLKWYVKGSLWCQLTSAGVETCIGTGGGTQSASATFNTTAASCTPAGSATACSASTSCGAGGLPCVIITHPLGRAVSPSLWDTTTSTWQEAGGISATFKVTNVAGTLTTTTFTLDMTTTTGIAYVTSMDNAGQKGDTGATGAAGSNGSGFNGRGAYAAMTASSPSLNDTWELTDASASGGCGSGGGTAKSVCIWNGSAWVVTSAASNIATTTNALVGNGSGGASAASGTSTNCVHVDGSSAACGGGVINSGASTAWFPWGPASFASNYWMALAANKGNRYIITIPVAIESTYLAFNIQTASGTACTGGTCGAVWAIRALDMTTIVAQTAVGVSGGTPDINATGAIRLPWSSGSAVSAGVLTLPAGTYWLSSNSDSTALKVTTYGDQAAANIANAGTTKYMATAGSATSSGDGASLTLTTDVSAVVWTGMSNVASIPLVAFIR